MHSSPRNRVVEKGVGESGGQLSTLLCTPPCKGPAWSKNVKLHLMQSSPGPQEHLSWGRRGAESSASPSCVIQRCLHQLLQDEGKMPRLALSPAPYNSGHLGGSIVCGLRQRRTQVRVTWAGHSQSAPPDCAKLVTDCWEEQTN